MPITFSRPQIERGATATPFIEPEYIGGENGTILNGDPSSPFGIKKGAEGLDALPYEIVSDSNPSVDGELFRDAYAKPRNIFLPMICEAETRQEFRTSLRTLIKNMIPKNGPGTLLIVDDTGDSRYIKAMYLGGMEGDESVGGDTNWWKYGLKLRALDPYWYGLLPETVSWTGGGASAFFPILPLILSPSSIGAQRDIPLAGDVEAWPTWSVKGPFTRVKATNDMTGKSWEITRPTMSTEYIEIITQPSAESVRETSQDLNAWGSLSGELWSLSPGDTVSLEADNGSSATTILLTIRPRYLTAP